MRDFSVNFSPFRENRAFPGDLTRLIIEYENFKSAWKPTRKCLAGKSQDQVLDVLEQMKWTYGLMGRAFSGLDMEDGKRE